MACDYDPGPEAKPGLVSFRASILKNLNSGNVYSIHHR